MNGISATTLETTDVAGFDYAQVEPAAREALQHAAESIRRRLGSMRSDGDAIGSELLSVKNQLEHGAFGSWIQAVIGITPRAAQNYMNVAKLMQGVPEPI